VFEKFGTSMQISMPRKLWARRPSFGNPAPAARSGTRIGLPSRQIIAAKYGTLRARPANLESISAATLLASLKRLAIRETDCDSPPAYG